MADDLIQLAIIQDVFSDDIERQLDVTIKFGRLLSKARNPPIDKVIECRAVRRFIEWSLPASGTLNLRRAYYPIVVYHRVPNPSSRLPRHSRIQHLVLLSTPKSSSAPKLFPNSLICCPHLFSTSGSRLYGLLGALWEIVRVAGIMCSGRVHCDLC
jgi:hypothetical protein